MRKDSFKSFLTEEEQFLAELQGYKMFSDMGFYEILTKLIDEHGHDWNSGSLGVVFIPKDKDYVYKCWINDGGYQGFLDIAEKHQDNPFFPKFLSKRKKLETFFKRPADFKDDINIIKMERLKPMRNGNDISENLMYMIKRVSQVDADKITLKWVKDQLSLRADKDSAKKALNVSIDKHAKGKLTLDSFNYRYREAMEQMRRALLKEKKLQKYLEPMYEAMSLLAKAKMDNNLHCDMHSGNFMVRNDGELVITDPFVVKGWYDQAVMNNLKTDHLEPGETTSGRKRTGSKTDTKSESK